MTDVFISYRREDRDDARAIAETLAADGYEVWWDWLLLPGDRFRDEITGFIEKAKAVLVLWSQESLRSDFVVDEAQLANRLGKYVPMSLDGSEPPLGLQNTHCVSLAEWRRSKAPSELESLLAAIRLRVGESSDKSSFLSQSLNHTMETSFWKTVVVTKDASPQNFVEGLDLYLEKFGGDGLFSSLARRLKADPSGRRRYQQEDPFAISEWKRPLNPNRILSFDDLVSVAIRCPPNLSPVDAAFSPDENNLIVAFNRSEPKGWFDHKFTGHLREFRIKDGSQFGNWGTQEGYIEKISLSPDGKRLAVVGQPCRVMDMATRITKEVMGTLGFSRGEGRRLGVHWSADSQTCLFKSIKENYKVQVAVRADGSIKETRELSELHECAWRNSWFFVARDSIAEIDLDLERHPAEVFVLDRLQGTSSDTRLAVSASGAYVAISQRVHKSEVLRVSVYTSKDWSRLGFWEVEHEYAIDSFWLGESAILTQASFHEYEVRQLPELQLTHHLKTYDKHRILPSVNARPALWIDLEVLAVKILGQF